MTLFNKIITNITIDFDDNSIIFKMNNNTATLYHKQDADEIVNLDSIEGDLTHLMNSKVIRFDKSTNSGMECKDIYGNYHYQSFTWSIYKITTQKGTVTFKWLITSDGLDCEQIRLHLT